MEKKQDKKQEKKPLNLNVDIEVGRLIKIQAINEGLSTSMLVEGLIINYLKEKKVLKDDRK